MRFVLLLAGLLLLPVVTHAAGWQRYTNPRYGFSVEVPAGLKAGEPPENGDGLAFTSPDGRTDVRVYGHLLGDAKDLPGDARRTETLAAGDGLQVTYRQASAKTFTLSGLQGNAIVYVRGVATCRGGAAAILWAEYPQADKARFDAVIARMARSLQGSEACGAP